MDGNKPFRYTRGKLSVETSFILIFLGWLWHITKEEIPIQPRAVFYHPLALLGTATVLSLLILSPWLLLVPVLAVFAWFVGWPESYIRHAHPRWQSFLAGLGYRRRIRRKLAACSLLNDKDSVPTISKIQKNGCITNVRLKMVYGDEINMWRVQSARIAQTYNALDCKINPYRRQTLNPFKKEQVTKVRWLQLEFLTKDPFNTGLGVEYLEYHNQQNAFSPVVAIHREGATHQHNLAAHRLRVAMTRWGKSVAIRAMIYSQRHNLQEGLLEIWGIDGKGGIEQSFLQHVFARVAYGDTAANPDSYNPAQFDRLLKDAVLVMKRRQRAMRGKATEHTPTPKAPWLLIVIDEILVLTSKTIPPALRNSIADSINLIQQQGAGLGVTLDASTQLGKKDKLDPIDRDGFTEFELGRTEPGVVDMIFGKGWWERGARADEIAKDLKGVFYLKTDTTMAPEQIRYPNITIDDVSAKALGFTVEKSSLWPLPPQNGSRNGSRTNGHRKTAKAPQHAHHAPQTASQPNGQHPVGDNGQEAPQPAVEAIPSSKEVQDYIGGFA